jgi:hypothetical protein
MTLTLEHGTAVELPSAAEMFRQAIDAADLPEPAPFLDWCSQILVDHPERRALVLKPGTVIDGDLLIDRDAEPFSGGISTIVALGDLIIAGRLINEDGDDTPVLLVAGSLTCRDIIKAGAAVAVLGSINADGVVVCDGDNGALLTGADLTASAIIDCDHEIYVAGSVSAVVASDDLGNMRTLLVPEVFDAPEDAEDQWPEGDLIRARLIAGQPVFKT